MVPSDKPHAAYEMFKKFIERSEENKKMIVDNWEIYGKFIVFG